MMRRPGTERLTDVVDRNPLVTAGLGYLRERRLSERAGGPEEAVGAAGGFGGGCHEHSA